MKLNQVIFFVLIFCCPYIIFGQSHPSLGLRKSGVSMIRKNTSNKVFDISLASNQAKVDEAILRGIEVPIPIDMAGGHTHEVHKSNYLMMQLAGNIYQIKGTEKYALYVKKMLFEYAKIYKTLPIHPTKKSYATGKIFWQCLNDANWLVYTAQAYDCIYDYLTKEERLYLENELFKPFADFLSIENPQFYNRIHNHSTWGNAAVGMIGLAMRDEELIQRSLYGIKDFKIDTTLKDNDGGYIFEKGQVKAGFFAQIDWAFSPDGYYNEGPYYQRYALLPFMVFAQSIHQNKPHYKIFEYRDNILLKSVKALLAQTNQKGEFFPINDAQKGMSIMAESMVTVIDIAYGVSKDQELLSAAKMQENVTPDQNGYLVSHDLESSKTKKVLPKSLILRDGKDGDEGALMILKSQYSNDQTAVAFKCTSQGLGHGHYDKLSYAMYYDDMEIMQDYGAARWVNIDQKAGGRYLPENDSWAKQSIAHNTLVVDETSHFGGQYAIANLNHSTPIYSYINDGACQVLSAKEENAYPNVPFQRNLLMWEHVDFDYPILIDLLNINSNEAHTYDLPFHYAGQILKTDFAYTSSKTLSPLGDDHGYQHIYKQAEANIAGETFSINWIKNGFFFTATAISSPNDQVILGTIGASDPNFNLRRDPLFIHRKPNTKETYFLSIIEQHGHYSPVTEIVTKPFSQLRGLTMLAHTDLYSIFKISSEDKYWIFSLAHQDGNTDSIHQLTTENERYKWKGPIQIQEFKNTKK